MRICFVCGNIYPLLSNRVDIPIVGGAEVQQYLIGKALAECGVEVCFVTEDFGQGVETNIGSFRILAYKFGANKIKQGITLWQALARANADIYYVRVVPNFGGLIYAFTRLYRRKIVQALGSDAEVMPELTPGFQNSFSFQVHCLWRSRSDLVIAQTRTQASLLAKRWKIRSEIIPNVSWIIPSHTSIRRETKFSVLWVGTISPRKRVELVGDIAKQLPEMNFTIVGGVASKFEDYYERVRHDTSGTNIVWKGHVPFSQVQPYFQMSDVLLHTADGNQEGFPNVFLQAWAAGVPVISISTDPDGLISQNQLGYCVNSVQEAVANLKILAEDEILRSEISQRARLYIAETHDIDKIIPRYQYLFSRLMGIEA